MSIRINGYINSQYLSGRDPSTRTQKFRDVSKTFTVTVRPSSANGRVNLWAQPCRRDAEVRTLNKGESLTVLSESNAWYLTEDANVTLGYVAKAYAKK